MFAEITYLHSKNYFTGINIANSRAMQAMSKAPSMRIQIFLKCIFYYPFWIIVHNQTGFSVTENEAFENASITASSCHLSKFALGSLGIKRGYFSLSRFKFRVPQRSYVGRNIFENVPRVDADHFVYR